MKRSTGIVFGIVSTLFSLSAIFLSFINSVFSAFDVIEPQAIYYEISFALAILTLLLSVVIVFVQNKWVTYVLLVLSGFGIVLNGIAATIRGQNSTFVFIVPWVLIGLLSIYLLNIVKSSKKQG
jgi:uncharacterized membrane protein